MKQNWRGTKGKCRGCLKEYVRGSGFKRYCSKQCRHKGINSLRDEKLARKAKRPPTKAEAILQWKKGKAAKTLPRRRDTPEQRQAFYASSEWRALRFKAFLKYGRKCLCCGATPPAVVLHVDHVKPRSQFPHLELDIRNLQILCADCNLGKSASFDTDFRPTP